jgi:homotetrameric cytidine deaminase
MKLTPKERALINAAVEARARAYAPYSRFQVGAALMLRDGQVVTGVNVENASYGLTVCAERNAIAAAVNAGAGPGDISSVAIATEAEQAAPPCGACRQVLAEFGKPESPVLLYNVKDGKAERATLAELLPHAFLRESLPGA